MASVNFRGGRSLAVYPGSQIVVTNANVTRPIWFDPGEEPEDSWRKLHPEPGSP